MKQVGILIDSVEFVPMDIMVKHMPFAVPPGTDVQAVFVEDDEEGDLTTARWLLEKMHPVDPERYCACAVCDFLGRRP